jgi:hypothetical protein
MRCCMPLPARYSSCGDAGNARNSERIHSVEMQSGEDGEILSFARSPSVIQQTQRSATPVDRLLGLAQQLSPGSIEFQKPTIQLAKLDIEPFHLLHYGSN